MSELNFYEKKDEGDNRKKFAGATNIAIKLLINSGSKEARSTLEYSVNAELHADVISAKLRDMLAKLSRDLVLVECNKDSLKI